MLQVERMVLVKSTGGAGIGDLIRAVLSGVHYAQVTGRSVHISWDDGLYGPIGSNVFNDLFELYGLVWEKSLPNVPDDWEVCPQAWDGVLDKPFNKLYASLRDDDWNRSWAVESLSFDQSRFDYDENLLVMWDFDQFEKSWRAADSNLRYGESPEDALRETATRHLKLTSGIQSVVDAFCAAHFRDVMIGVHVRRTYEKGGETRHVNDHQYFKAIDIILNKNPEAGVFLATDNWEVEAAFRQRYPHLVTTRKWLPENAGEALHFAKDVQNKMQCAKEALIDIYLLASCDYLVYPQQSSFSRVASIIGQFPDHRLFPQSRTDGLLHRVKQKINRMSDRFE